MEENAIVEQSGLGQFAQQLWSRQIGHHADECEDDELERLEEECQLAVPEGTASAKHLYSTRTVLKATPKELSPSGQVYQRVQHSQVEYLRPSMSIRSSHSLFASSVKPLPPPKAPSLMRWMHTANLMSSPQHSENSQSPRRGKLHSALRKLTG
uniref:MP n=1 Tax=Lettuce yellows virus TaxID=1667233 RepID=A0A0P1CZ31_9VIRU|nr:MP [Lettuce yellows virus]